MSKKRVVHNLKTKELSIFEVVGEGYLSFSHMCGSILQYILPIFLVTMNKSS